MKRIDISWVICMLLSAFIVGALIDITVCAEEQTDDWQHYKHEWYYENYIQPEQAKAEAIQEENQAEFDRCAKIALMAGTDLIKWNGEYGFVWYEGGECGRFNEISCVEGDYVGGCAFANWIYWNIDDPDPAEVSAYHRQFWRDQTGEDPPYGWYGNMSDERYPCYLIVYDDIHETYTVAIIGYY